MHSLKKETKKSGLIFAIDTSNTNNYVLFRRGVKGQGTKGACELESLIKSSFVTIFDGDI